MAEAKLNKIVYSVYTWPVVSTAQLINAWHQAGLSRGFVDYSESGEQMHRKITHTHWVHIEYRVHPRLKIEVKR